MFGLGPEINMPLGKHPIFLTFRYLFDVRSRVSTQGQYAFLSVVWAHPSKPDLPAKATCSAQPTEVMPGEPVTVTATADNFDPKHTLTYSWNSTGGKISGPETSGTVDTSGLAAGTYTATARVSDPKKKAAEAELLGELHGEGSSKESADIELLGEPLVRAGWNQRNRQLHLHQPGQCPSDCRRVDRQRRHHLGK